MDTLEKVVHQKKYLEDLGYNVLYIGLFGSQNYGLDDEDSDIDLRAIVLPTLEQLIRKERISKHIETDMGIIDVKDPVAFHDVIVKGNFTYIEVLQTKYYLGPKFFRELYKDIRVNLRSLKGDMYGKARAFRPEYIEFDPDGKTEYGGNPKELSQLLRLLKLVELCDTRVSFIDYTNNEEIRSFLMDIKRNTLNIIDTLDLVIDISSFTTLKKWIEFNTRHLIPKEYEADSYDMLDEVVNYTKQEIVERISDEETYKEI